MRAENIRDAKLMGCLKLIDEFNLAGDAYSVGNYNKELFHMIRAGAIRDALDIDSCTYEDLKRMIEIQHGLDMYTHFIDGNLTELEVKANGGV